MTDKAEARLQERRSIDLRDGEIEFWCDKLHCSEEALRRAVADVGQSPLTVAEHLGLTEASVA